MNVLGLSAHFHDAAAALIVDGQLVAAAAEERFSRLRHDASFPKHAARFCLEQAGLTAHDLDSVVFYEEPHQKFTRVLATTLGGFPRTLGPFVGAMKGWLSHKLFVRGGISKALDVHPDLVHMVPHHLSHAAAAFAAAGVDEAAVLVVDAVGEWACTTLGRARRGEGVTVSETVDYPHSIGLFYAAMTAFLGFRPNADECTTMALAAFGRPVRRDAVAKVLRLEADGAYSLDAGYFDFLQSGERLFTPRFRALFGPPAPEGCFRDLDAMAGGPLSPEAQAYADLAASVQAHLEDAVLGLARRLHARTPCDTLVFAGGVALNCVANGRLAAEGPFARVVVPLDPGDGGGAVGAALLGADPRFERASSASATPFLGAPARGDLLDDMLPHLEAHAWHGGAGTLATRSPRAVRWQRHDGDAPLLDDVVGRLVAGQAVGWVQGRFELGPRALGARSLLLAPGRVDRARHVSKTIKRRASLRPYALSCTAEARDAVFAAPPAPSLERWMQTAAPLRPDALEGLRAGAHVDGTTRPQVVHAAELPRFHALLQAFGAATGGPAALLNTSLNERGEPIVGSAVEALALLARTDLDALVVDDLVIWKEW